MKGSEKTMDREIISNKQGICMMVLFIFGSSIVIGMGGYARQDVWISILIALIMSLPMIFIYAKLLTVNPGKDLYDILNEIFGPIVGRIISMLFVWYSFHLGALVIRNFSEFVNVISFPETPQFIVIIFLGLSCIWAVKAGIEVLGRWSAFILPLIILILIITLILSATKVNLINLKPVLYYGMKPVLSNAFSVFAFPFAETIVFTMALHTLKNSKEMFKVFLISALIGCGIILFADVRNILVLGVQTATNLYFPSYMAVRTINIGEFLQRFEILIAVNFMMAGFVKICVCLYVASNGVAKILNIKNYRHLIAPIGFLMMHLAWLIYSSTMEMFDWASKIYPYYAIPFQIVLPVIIFIAAKIKFRNRKQKLTS